jgi:hypothetical protein
MSIFPLHWLCYALSDICSQIVRYGYAEEGNTPISKVGTKFEMDVDRNVAEDED